jgi:hypothetical protein
MNTIQDTFRETRAALSKRIKAATTREELHRLDGKCDKLYNAGCLSPSGLAMLDCMIMHRLARMEVKP